MSALTPLASKGKGTIAVILPTTASTTHFANFDARYLTKSFQHAGLNASQYSIQMEVGNHQFSAAQAAIHDGASVLIVDARYSGVGTRIESYAKARHVPVIDYDWLTIGGTRSYYVGFDSWKIGALLGQGLVSCVSAWHVKHPRIIVMRGAPDDYNVAWYAQGYNAILTRQFSSGWKDVSNPAGTWNQPVALSEFRQQYTAHKQQHTAHKQQHTAHKNINAALIPNDENGAYIIHYLQSKGVKAKTFPTTGLDATQDGLRNILTGYQCGTVYKPVWLEAQAAAALAIYVRAGVAPPVGLHNWNITDPQTRTPVPSVLLTPEWVTVKNMKSTVIADWYVSAAQLCSGNYAAACAKAGISS